MLRRARAALLIDYLRMASGNKALLRVSMAHEVSLSADERVDRSFSSAPRLVRQ